MALRPRPGIMEITPYVGGGDGEGANAIKLSANEAALGPSPRAVAAYRDLAERLHLYPDGGAVKLRHAIGRRFDLDPARIVCGAGSDELIALLIRAYAGPGDEVIHTEHAFLMYKLSALAAGATPVAAPERDLTADVDAILARVTTRTRMVFLAHPNNPTGSYLPPDEMERLRAGLPEDALLVLDGAYAEYVRCDDYADGRAMVDRHANVATTRTFSKLFGLAALRLGWLYAPAPIVDVLNRVRGPFNVGSAALAAGVAALEDLDHQEANVAHNDRWRAYLADEIAALGLGVPPGVGNFVLVRFPADGGRDAKSAEAFLAARGLIVRAMNAYGLPDCLRITVGTEAANRAVIGALRDFAA